MNPGRMMPGTLMAEAVEGIDAAGPAASIFFPETAKAPSATIPGGNNILPAIVQSAPRTVPASEPQKTTTAAVRATIMENPTILVLRLKSTETPGISGTEFHAEHIHIAKAKGLVLAN